MATGAKVDFSRTVHYNESILFGVIMKLCSMCKLEKTFDEFVKHKGYKDGIYCYCKACVRQKNTEYRATDQAKERRIINRALYRERNRERIREQDRNNYKKDPEKFKARARTNMKKYLVKSGFDRRNERKKLMPEIEQARILVTSAVRNGTLTKPKACKSCGMNQSRIEAHHENYFEPLDIKWLCVKCHRKIHRKSDHADRLSGKTSNMEDATVKTSEETTRGISEEGTPPNTQVCVFGQ